MKDLADAARRVNKLHVFGRKGNLPQKKRMSYGMPLRLLRTLLTIRSRKI